MSTPITLTLTLSAGAAVRLGSGRAGPAKLHLDDRDLQQLTPRQRETLALHLERREGWGAPLTDGGPPIGVATLDALRTLLDARADKMATGDAPRCASSGREIESDGRCGQCRFIGCSARRQTREGTGEILWPVCDTQPKDGINDT